MGNYRIFIDESCHLEHDELDVMAIGYIKVPEEQYEILKNRIKNIKQQHDVPHEIKWNHVSRSKLPLFIELIDFFFESDMSFRTIVVKYKKILIIPSLIREVMIIFIIK